MKKKITGSMLALVLILSACFVNAEEVPDLSGVWLTENRNGSWMEAIIEGDSITVNWVFGSGEKKSIYWAGTYTAPAEGAGEYAWTSERDVEKTDTVLLASADDTKEFTYSAGAISTEVSTLGFTAVEYFYPEAEANDVYEDADYESMYSDLLSQYNQLQEDYNQLKTAYDALTGGVSDEKEEENVEEESSTEDSAAETDIIEEMTEGEQNALADAESYLSLMSFSYPGLIDQLQYEGYSVDEATFAADHCGADWSEQAVRHAESYLNLISLSRDGLVTQLEYDGFTEEEANFAADAVGY